MTARCWAMAQPWQNTGVCHRVQRQYTAPLPCTCSCSEAASTSFQPQSSWQHRRSALEGMRARGRHRTASSLNAMPATGSSQLQPAVPAQLSSQATATGEQLRLAQLAEQLQTLGVSVDISLLQPGRTTRQTCPLCKGGEKHELNSFCIWVNDSATRAKVKCWRQAKCGFSATVGESRPGLAWPLSRSSPKALELQARNDVTDYFLEQGISRETLQACSIQQWHGVVAPEGDLDRDQQPQSLAVLSYSRNQHLVMQLDLDINRARLHMDFVRRAHWKPDVYLPDDSLTQLPRDAEKLHHKPGSGSVLWGFDEACREVRRALEAGEEPPVLYLVEDYMDRLALVEAGMPAAWVLALPPGARRRFQGWLARTENAAKDPRGAVQAAQRWRDAQAAAGGSAGQDAALDYMRNTSDELWELCSTVVLALHDSPASEQLGEELARRIGPERCALLKWPAQRDELHGSSKHSAYHAAYQDWQLKKQRQGAFNMVAIYGGIETAQSIDNQYDQFLNEMQQQQQQGSGQDSDPDEALLPVFGALEPKRWSAHDMLLQDGGEALLWHLQRSAQEWPLKGLYQFGGFYQEILDLYDQTRSNTIAASSGWPGLDSFYRVLPGELTIVTVNLAECYDWPIAFCSFEKSVEHHAMQLIEKFLRRPLLTGPRSERPDIDTFCNAMEFIDDRFVLIRRDSDKLLFNQRYGSHNEEDGYEHDEPGTGDGNFGITSTQGEPEATPTISWVLEKAEAAVKRHGIRGLVIDPYNELDHSRPSHITETEYISGMLSQVKRFAQRYDVHVWLVAHPKQLMDWQGKAPSLYDISGSAHFINKADCGVVVHRDWESGTRKVNIIVQKMRNKAAGKIGSHELLYEVETGRYSSLDEDGF